MSATEFEAALKQAVRHLTKVDRVLAGHIKRVGACGLERSKRFEPFHALLSSIAHQQLNGKAASTILQRVRDRVGQGRWPDAQTVHQTRLPSLRACGLSRAKSLAVKDLAAKTLDGTVPRARQLHLMGDEEIVERLTEVRGIGRWTVQMMLMFRLGRLDVLPIDDYGVRKGYSQLYELPELITPKALLVQGERWAPYRSVASWYLWRVLDG